jgi:sugar diacid utilization regulator
VIREMGTHARMEGIGDSVDQRSGSGSAPASTDGGDWLTRVAKGACQDAGGVSEEFLGDYLPMLADAATVGRRPSRGDLDAVRLVGRRAAESGISAARGVDLYLSAARRVWDELPSVVRERDSAAVRAAAEALLHVIDDAVASFAGGHAEAGRELVRREETVRRELIEDLLRGDAHLGELVERAEPFGLDLTRAHQVALAKPGQRLSSIDAATSSLERVVLDRFGDRDMLVTTKEGLVVVLALADATLASGTTKGAGTTGNLGSLLYAELSRLRRGSPWRVAVGRAHPGAYGIARSYEEAREGLNTAARMQLGSPVVESRDILLYRVLFRDQPAIVDLVHSTLDPLRQARGGARPLLDTLEAYFECGSVATAAAKQLHLSVRAVTYRLDRVKTMTAYDPVDPTHRLTLQTAVLGAKLLGWPENELPSQTLPRD